MNTEPDRLMTEQELAQSREKWDKIGVEGSKERDCAFMILRLALEIEQAHVPNQLPNYVVSRFEQARLSLRAIRQTFGLTNGIVRGGMKRLMDIGLLHDRFNIPDDLGRFENDAIRMIKARENARTPQ